MGFALTETLTRTLAGSMLAAPMLAGCVIAIGGDGDDGETHWSGDRGGRYETLLAVEVRAQASEVILTASSNGCTREASFRTDVNRERGVYQIGFRRTERDLCRALMPEGARLVWTYAQLGVPDGATVAILNPVGR
jgi:hypothetical protein